MPLTPDTAIRDGDVELLRVAVAHAAADMSDAAFANVEALLRVAVERMVDAGATARDVHRALRALFLELKAPYVDPVVRSRLDVLDILARSHGLARLYVRGEPA